MHIAFSSIDEFLDEVSRRMEGYEPNSEDVSEILENIVRVQIEEQRVNQSLSEFWVRAGFIDILGNLNQIELPCGREPPNHNMPSGKGAAEQESATLRARLRELKVDCRSGSFQGGG